MSLAPGAPAVRRQLVATRHGQVHLRLAGEPGGSAPSLVLLHFTPYSSLQFEPFMQLLASDRLVLAADRLGFGCSDPHPTPGLSLAGIAAATLEAVDAVLGGQQFDLIGIHTGAIASRPSRSCSTKRSTSSAGHGTGGSGSPEFG